MPDVRFSGRRRMTPGQIAYEAECAAWPYHHDGTRRPTWAKLCDVAQWSWERDPTPRDRPQFARKSPLPAADAARPISDLGESKP